LGDEVFKKMVGILEPKIEGISLSGFVNRALVRTLTWMAVFVFFHGVSTRVHAQLTFDDVYQVDYFSNANTMTAPDGLVRITNAGTSGRSLCASIYVFAPNQVLSECCGCYLWPNAFLALSINHLTSNPVNGTALTSGTIKIVSSLPIRGTCPLPTNITPKAALRSFALHIQQPVVQPGSPAYRITEAEFATASLSSAELQNQLEFQCSAVALGSGAGHCSCK
jgi:hypothetical protein